jgi:hypothetical protein
VTEAEATLIADEVDEILLSDSFPRVDDARQAGRLGDSEAQGASVGCAPEHDPEKCDAVFRKDHVQTTI